MCRLRSVPAHNLDMRSSGETRSLITDFLTDFRRLRGRPGALRTSQQGDSKQGRIIQPESSCIVYYTYYIMLCIISCIIFTYDFKTIRPKSNSIIHNTQYNTYYVLIRIMYCHTLVSASSLNPTHCVIPCFRRGPDGALCAPGTAPSG